MGVVGRSKLSSCIGEGTEETNFVFARESPCFNEYHHLIVCILKRRQQIGKI
jgi:hypothetical protein